MAHDGNIRKIQQDQYAANRAFHAYQDAVEAWARATVELDKAHEKMTAAAVELRKFMNTP
jgi:exonuclease VII small subunit